MLIRKIEVTVCEDCFNGEIDQDCASPECAFHGESCLNHGYLSSGKVVILSEKNVCRECRREYSGGN